MFRKLSHNKVLVVKAQNSDGVRYQRLGKNDNKNPTNNKENDQYTVTNTKQNWRPIENKNKTAIIFSERNYAKLKKNWTF